MRLPTLPAFFVKSCICLSSALIVACQDHFVPANTFLFFSEASNHRVLSISPNGTTIYNGGFGSALAADPANPAVFYLLTDRGPNAAGTAANSIIFGKADFTPQIGQFRLVGDQLVLERTILLKTATGELLNGLPNLVGQGNTGETALDLNGQPIVPNPTASIRKGWYWLLTARFGSATNTDRTLSTSMLLAEPLSELIHSAPELAGVPCRKCSPGDGLTGAWKC